MRSQRQGVLAVVPIAAGLAAVLLLMGPVQAEVLVTDNFDSYAVGSVVNGQGGWTDTGGATPRYKITAAGVAGTRGVDNGPGASVQLNWTAHAFKWSDVPLGEKVIFAMDFQASSANTFDDDRLAWVNSDNPTSSAYMFGTQIDNSDGGIVTYWRTSYGGSSRVQIPIVPKANYTTVSNAWYRLETDIQKLSATSARIDVFIWALDAAGVPGAAPLASGTIADTSALPAGQRPPTQYFTGNSANTTMIPSYKNYNGVSGNADNALFAITSEPATMALLSLAGLGLLRRRNH